MKEQGRYENSFEKTMSMELQLFRNETTGHVLKNEQLTLREKFHVWLKTINYDTMHQIRISAYLESFNVTIFFGILTLIALYLADIQRIFTDVKADLGFSIIYLVIFVFFLVEWILLTYSTPDYLLSYFFWLDLLSSLTILLDLHWINISGNNGNDSEFDTQSPRVLKLLRLLRLTKLTKTIFLLFHRNRDDDEFGGQSKLGTKLIDLITKKIAISILLFVIIVPFLNADDTKNLYPIENIGKELNNMYHLLNENQFNDYIDMFKSSSDADDVIFLKVGNIEYINEKDTLNSLRNDEQNEIKYGDVTMIIDIEVVKIIDSIKLMVLTTFLIIVACTMATVFNYDIQKYVVNPINIMLNDMDNLAKNKLSTFESDSDMNIETETSMLHGSISRIGHLLKLGFGEAGAEIIKYSLGDDLQSNINAKGTKINGIYAFCDIRQFTDTTECLKEDIMKFVNQCADIVHDTIVQHKGAPNKNVGDAFLLVWKLPEKTNDNMEIIQNIANNALVSLIKINIEIHRRNKDLFQQWIHHPGIIQRFGYDKYRVRLGWGLHAGQSIEGLIGSKYKIDASYMSENVNLSEDLEGLTKFYGVSFLVSEMLYALLSPFMKTLCRLIDVIKITGIEHEFKLYCVDIWELHKDNYMNDNRQYNKCGRLKAGDFVEYTDTEKEMFYNEKLVDLQYGFDKQHKKIWRQGVELYINGDWENAKHIMEQVLDMLPTDGPCKAIYGFIQENGFKAPQNWNGYRNA